MTNKVSNLTYAFSKLNTSSENHDQSKDNTNTKSIIATSSTSIVDLPSDISISKDMKSDPNDVSSNSSTSFIPAYNQTPLPSFTNSFSVRNSNSGFLPSSNKNSFQSGTGSHSRINSLKQIINDNNVRESKTSDSSLLNEVINEKDDISFSPVYADNNLSPNLDEHLNYTEDEGTDNNNINSNNILNVDGFIDYEQLLIEKEKKDKLLLQSSSYTSVDYDINSLDPHTKNHKDDNNQNMQQKSNSDVLDNDLEPADTLTSLPTAPTYDDTDNDSNVITYKRTISKQDSISSFSTFNTGSVKNSKKKPYYAHRNGNKIQKPVGKPDQNNTKIINLSIYSGSESDISKPPPKKPNQRDSIIFEGAAKIRSSNGVIISDNNRSNHIIVDFPKSSTSTVVTTANPSAILSPKDNSNRSSMNNMKLVGSFLKSKQQQSNNFKKRISSTLKKNVNSFTEATSISSHSTNNPEMSNNSVNPYFVNGGYSNGASSNSLKKMINFIGNSGSFNNTNTISKNKISGPVGLKPKASNAQIEIIDSSKNSESKNKIKVGGSGSDQAVPNSIDNSTYNKNISIGGKVTGALVNYKQNLKYNYKNNMPSSLKKNKNILPEGMKNLQKVQFVDGSVHDDSDDEDQSDTNLISFIDKYILPNCDIIYSFDVFRDEEASLKVSADAAMTAAITTSKKNKKSKHSAHKQKHNKRKKSHNNNDNHKGKKSEEIHEDTDKEILMITNSNVPLSKKSTSATSLARKFSLSKKNKNSETNIKSKSRVTSDNTNPIGSKKLNASSEVCLITSQKNSSSDTEFIITEDIKIKNIYKLETDDFLKLFKFWTFDHILPKCKDVFPYLHNLDYNVSQYAFFNNFYDFNALSSNDVNSGNVSSKSTNSLKKEDLVFHMNDLRFNSIDNNNREAGKSKNDLSDHQLNDSMNSGNDTNGACSNLSRFVPLPNSDKYLLLINTDDGIFQSCNTANSDHDSLLQDSKFFDGDDIDTSVDNEAGLSLKVLNYLQKCFYLKGSIPVDDILEYDDFENVRLASNDDSARNKDVSGKSSIESGIGGGAKKKTSKVRFEFNDDDNDDDNNSVSSSSSGGDGSDASSISNNASSNGSNSSETSENEEDSYFEDVRHDEYDDIFEGHEYIKLKQMIHNGKRYSNFSQPLNLLKRVNGYSSNLSNRGSKNGDGNLNLYDKKINLRNYGFQSILLFKIANVVIYNNQNNHELNLKFAKIFSLLQKKIYLHEYYKKMNLNFRESLCFILNFEIDKIINFNIIHYNENENVILNKKKNINHNLDDHLVKNSSTYNPAIYTRFETIDTFTKKNTFFYHNNSTNLKDLLKSINESSPFLILGNNTKKGLKNDLNDWSKNYLLHEKFENWLITSSFKIYKNFYVGNIVDYNNTISLNRNKEKYNKILEQIETLESGGTAEDPGDSTILRKQLLQLQNKISNNDNKSGGQMINYRILINCKEGVQFPNMKMINKINQDLDNLLKRETDLIYLEFPSSGSILSNSLTKQDIILIINFLKLLKVLIDKDLNILIYCYDGFTHNSILLLMFEIFNSFINLNNAILKYYKIYERYIYWFKIDFELLKILEPYLLFYSDKNPNNSLATSGTSILSPTLSNKEGKFDNDDFIINIKINDVKTWYNDVYLSMYSLNSFEFLKIENHADESNIIEEHRKLDDKLTIELRAKSEDWFSLQNDNNFPSKILPYLYLGSLAHLNSKTILEILGINHVISIGEKPQWIPETYENKFVSYADGNKSADPRLASRDIIEIDSPLPFIKKLIYLPNLQDNGIDSFDAYFETLLKMIKKIRKKNDAGSIKSKIFINCKAGVSRSASLCISEVMNFLKISLSRAYLYVRVRRLNLIIQPNLKIFYNILSLEEYLTTKENNKIKYYNSKVFEYNNTSKKKDLKFKKIKPLREIDWHVLCKEIDLLNNHYIK